MFPQLQQEALDPELCKNTAEILDDHLGVKAHIKDVLCCENPWENGGLPGLVNVDITMERSTMHHHAINGKTHYFHGQFQSLCQITGGYLSLCEVQNYGFYMASLVILLLSRDFSLCSYPIT